MPYPTTCEVPLDRPKLPGVGYPVHEPIRRFDRTDYDDRYQKTWFPFSTTSPDRLWYFHDRAVNTITPQNRKHYPPRETYEKDADALSLVRMRHTTVGVYDEVFTVVYQAKNGRKREYRGVTLTLQISYQAIGLIGQHWGEAEILTVIHTPPIHPSWSGVFFLLEQVTKVVAMNIYHLVGQLAYHELNAFDLRNPATLKPLSDLSDYQNKPDSPISRVVTLFFNELAERHRLTINDQL